MELTLPGGVAERRPLWSRPVAWTCSAEPRTCVCGGPGGPLPSARKGRGLSRQRALPRSKACSRAWGGGPASSEAGGSLSHGRARCGQKGRPSGP